MGELGIFFQWLNMYGSSICIRQINQPSQKNFGKRKMTRIVDKKGL